MKKIWKQVCTMALASVITVSAAMPFAASDDVTVRVGAMAGATAMGMVKLMDQAEKGETVGQYEFADLMTDPSAYVAPLAKGEIDIAALPGNLASVIYNNTEGGVQILAAGVLSVLYIVERGESIQSVADLKGRQIYATGQGATPECVLRYVLKSNGINPDEEVEFKWCADTTEALAYITEDENAVAMLPQPFVTAACAKTEGLRVALNLGEEWKKVDPDSQVITGVVVVRTAFAQEHPQEVETFLEEYAASAAYTAEDVEGAAALIEKYGIVGSAAIAAKALPACSVSCVTGEELKEMCTGYYNVLMEENPKLLGGSMPGDDFFYSAGAEVEEATETAY